MGLLRFVRRENEPTQTQTPLIHVDVVKNEWLAGYQVVVARVFAGAEDGLRVDGSDHYPEMVQRYRRELGEQDDASFLAALSTQLRGDYVFATEPHDESSCPYHEMVVPLAATEPQVHAQA